jgi:hypothetical protein
MAEIANAIDVLGSWRCELEAPRICLNGEVVAAYPDGVPEGLRVDELDGMDQKMLRAELLLVAGKLEVLAQL